MNIYVGNLSFKATEDDLRNAFEPFGEVFKTRIPLDRETGRTRGFGFVEMVDRESGLTAIDALNGTSIAGRPVNVNEAKPRPPRDNSSWNRNNNRDSRDRY